MVEIKLIIEVMMIIFSIIFVVEFSGIIKSISDFLYQLFLNKKNINGWIIPKPFSCALCMTFWVLLFYTYFNTNDIVISIFTSSVGAMSTIVLTPMFTKIIDKINDKLL